MTDLAERTTISQIAYNAGLEIRYAVARSGVDPIQHIPEVDAIIERLLLDTRREALEEAARLIERDEIDANIRLDHKRHNSIGDWFREQRAAAIRRLAEQEGTE